MQYMMKLNNNKETHGAGAYLTYLTYLRRKEGHTLDKSLYNIILILILIPIRDDLLCLL